MSCQHFHEFMEQQKEELIKAIDEDKWYLSESQQHDVGIKEAKDHFLNVFLKDWATRFRTHYCTEICPEKNTCEKVEK